MLKEDQRTDNILHNCFHGGEYSVRNHNLVKIDFSSNINPLGISKKVIKELKKNINVAYVYPDPNCTRLKESILDYLDCNIDEIDKIITGNGATELIHYFSSTFAKKVLIPSPTFCEYELASKRNNAEVIFSPVLEDFQIDSESIIRVTKNSDYKIDSIFLCNPNNPTGKNSKRQITDIIEKIDTKITILLDESYIEFIDSNNTKDYSYFINLTKDYRNLVVLRSLTKAFGLAGLRIGYVISNKKIIEKMNNKLISWNVNGLAQVAAIEALKDKEHINSARINNRSEKRRIFRLLKNNNKLKTITTDVNFFLIKILTNKSSTELADELLIRDNILVRDCKSFTGLNNKFIRVAIRTKEENNKLLRALTKAL